MVQQIYFVVCNTTLRCKKYILQLKIVVLQYLLFDKKIKVKKILSLQESNLRPFDLTRLQ
jgi:hypothetical protein